MTAALAIMTCVLTAIGSTALLAAIVNERRRDIAIRLAIGSTSTRLLRHIVFCVLFGDGAGATVLRKSNGSGRGIVSSVMRSDGNLAELLYRPGGGTLEPVSQSMLDAGRHLIKMEGREVFKNAVRSMSEACDTALKRAGLTTEDIDLLVPHQANIRIIEAMAKYAGLPIEKVFINVDRYGNMSSASVPVGLDEAQEQGLIGPGANILTVAFGAGLTWGATALRW
jgi:3-oxoacyl-[acyl-carrier-protein] synthase-3